MSSQVFLLHAYTPIHQGVGQVPAMVDLPIAREKPYGFPIIRNTKGPIRAWWREFKNCRENDPDCQQEIERIFGPENISSNEEAHAGGCVFSDAYLLFFPVMGAYKPFYLLTSPMVLSRFARHMEIIGEEINMEAVKEECLVSAFPSKGIVCRERTDGECRYKYEMLEGFEIMLESGCVGNCVVEEILKDLGNRDFVDFLRDHLMIVPDYIFKYVVRSLTEVVPRVKLSDAGVVDSGPWWEEYVPAETIFYMWITSRGNSQDCDLELDGRIIDMGGKSTIGKGKVKFIRIWGR